MKSKPFCYAPWTTAQYANGGVSPCCEWNGEKFKGAVKDYHNSDYLDSIKTAMQNRDMNVISKTCSECITTEKHSTKSARKYINRNVKRDHYKIDSLNKLDYRPDNLCNLKCRMCSMHSSSLIEEEFLANGWDPIEKQNTLDVMDFDLSELKTLALLGGEPTVNKRMFPILDFFIENNMTDSVKLNYTTNCTSINNPWMSRAEKFKDININLSIDAAGKAYEYIRTGAEWKKVENNIHKIIDIAEEYHIQMVVQTTSFAIIEDWIEYFLQFPPEVINMAPMYGVPGKLDCIPDHIKADKIKYLKSLNHPTADQAIKHLNMHTYNPEEVVKYKKYNGWLDSIRGTSIYDLDPIFGEILREPFCTKPWTELSYNTNGVRPCCVWNGEKYQGDLSEYKSSKYIKRIKKSMIDHNMDFLNKSCFDCIDNEKQNLYSPRQARQAKHLELFEYWPSNICNLKCIMCSANNSNLIEEEEINLGLRQPVEKHITDISKFDFENVKILRVYGGEPTAGVHTFQQLKSVADRGYAKNITLAYTTNATSYNKIWTNIANQFAETDVGISVDGTGKVFEYIRQNAKWNKVEENIFKIINDATNYKFSIVLQTTSFILVDKWIDFFFQFPVNNIGMYQLYDVPGRLTAIPDNIKQRLINKLENKNHVLANKIINILQNAEFNIEELQAYKDYVLMLDRRRGTNILELDPVFEELLK